MGKLAALMPAKARIEIGKDGLGEPIYAEVRALKLPEMISLFDQNHKVFLSLYASALDKTKVKEELSPFLLAAPDLVNQILWLGMDAEDDEDRAVIAGLPVTVQMFLLEACWTASVPDAKKAVELLSGVMAKLRSLSVNKRNATSIQNESLKNISPVVSVSSPQAVTA